MKKQKEPGNLALFFFILVTLLAIGLFVPYFVIYFQNDTRISAFVNTSMSTPLFTVVENIGIVGFGVLKMFTSPHVDMFNVAGESPAIVATPNPSTQDVEFSLEHLTPSPTTALTAAGTNLEIQVDSFGRIISQRSIDVNRIMQMNGKSGHLTFSVGANLHINPTVNGFMLETQSSNIIVQHLNVMNGTTLDNEVQCNGGPMDSSCFDLSMQSCTAPLSASCIPNGTLFFQSLTVNEVNALQTSNFQVGNQTAIGIDTLNVTQTMSFNGGPIMCDSGGKLSSECVKLECAAGHFLLESCFSDYQQFENVTITNMLSVNDFLCQDAVQSNCIDLSSSIMCASPMDHSCVPPSILTINGETATDFSITGAGSVLVQGLDIIFLGENNTASNTGVGQVELFKQKTGSNFEFKNLASGNGTNISLIADAITLIIDNSAANIGTFSFANVTVDEFGRIVAANTQTPSFIAPSNVGTKGVGVLKQNLMGVMQVRGVQAGIDFQVSSLPSGDEIEIDVPEADRVVPGTYGNSSHIAQINVTQGGRIVDIETHPLIINRIGTYAYSFNSAVGVLYNNCPSCLTSSLRFVFPRDGVYSVVAAGAYCSPSVVMNCAGQADSGTIEEYYVTTVTRFFSQGQSCLFSAPCNAQSVYFTVYSLF